MTQVDYRFSEQFAMDMDEQDPLRRFKDCFFYPEFNGKESIYFCGNSLGLQPKSVKDYLQEELDTWGQKGVEGHFQPVNPWVDARLRSKPPLAKLVGANDNEVVAMGSLTANLHFLMVSFYRPTPTRFKIITEADAFPSDQYMLDSQVRFHGYDPSDAIIELRPRPGEYLLRTDDILNALHEHRNETALVMMAGVQYYTGQFFDLEKITKAGIEMGARVGFDLAHAVGNVPLKLNHWGVDFAAWCSYKYLNSGPGNIAGIFVHEKHASSTTLQRFAGWWGHDEKERFEMGKVFKPMTGADGWQLSNDNVLGLAAHQASLEIFEKAGMDRLRTKSELLTGFLEFLIQQITKEHPIAEIISPKNPFERGCQLSLLIHKGGKAVFDELSQNGIIADWRNPDVIRLAPAPLYNSFKEVFRFAVLLEKSLERFSGI